MKVQFDKLHGLGNDFVFLDTDEMESVSRLPSKFYRFISDRKLGIGCDLVVRYCVRNSKVEAEFFNQDGSSAEICGNACRCMGILLHKRIGISQFTIHVGSKQYEVSINNNLVSVDMGVPSFEHSLIGISDVSINVCELKEYLSSDSRFSEACAVSIGNPHLILFANQSLSINDMLEIGTSLESHALFKNRINVSFAEIQSEKQIKLSVFERGVGLTSACGSGACATAFVSFYLGKTEKNLKVLQRGGDLDISIDNDSHVTQTGEATYVFHGEIDI